VPALCRQRLESLDGLERAQERLSLKERQAKGGSLAAPVPVHERGLRGKGACQQAKGQRAIGHKADALRLAVGQHLPFHAPVQQVIAYLIGRQVAIPFAGLHHLHGKVGDPIVADLACLLERLQRAHGLFKRRVGVGPMDEQQVDIIRLQAPEAAFRGPQDGLAAGIAALVDVVLVYPEANFGDQDDLLAAVAKHPAQDLLAIVWAIDLGRIDQRNACVDGLVDGQARLLHVDLPVLRCAQLPGAKTNHGRNQVAIPKASLFHSASL